MEISCSYAPFVVEGEVAGAVLVVRDITERKKAEQEIETRTYQQAVVAELGLRALENDDLQSLMDEATALVARTLGVEYSKVMELLPGGKELLLQARIRPPSQRRRRRFAGAGDPRGPEYRDALSPVQACP